MGSGSLNLFRLGRRGVNVVTAPTHLTDDELTLAQNAEVVSVGGECAIDQRPGMTRINAVALNSGASVLTAHDVLATFLSDYTPYLYAGMNTAAAHTWRRSVDGVTWTDVDVPAKPFAANANIAGFFKNFPKAVTVGRALYYVDGQSTIRMHSFDGTTDTILSTVPPAVTGSTLTTPAFWGVFAEEENVGATTYTYKFVAKQGSAFNSAASAAFSVTTGPAALGASNFIDLSSANHQAFQNTLLVTAGVTSIDVYRTAGGATQGKIGTIPIVNGAVTRGNGSGATGKSFPAGSILTLGAGGSDAGGTYTYKIVPVQGSNHGIASAGVTKVWNSVLSGADYIRVVGFSVQSTQGLNDFGCNWDVYRTAGGATQGKIGTLVYASSELAGSFEFHDTGLAGDGTTAPTTGTGLQTGFADAGGYASDHGYGGGDPVFSDAGLTGDATTAPASASGGAAGAALGVLDMITDGTFVYLAVLDNAVADPLVYGRILRFDPASSLWSQIGATFFTASGNGAAGTLAFFDGALSYGTYIGITAASTGYLTSTLNPLPAGGITEIKTTAASLPACSMVVFNGEVYVGCVSLVAATAAIILKRAAINTWTTVRTGPATAQYNAYTSLGVFNGTLFAGWTSGGGATAARIEASTDGIVWTSEIALDVAEVVTQMVVFNNALYVVLGRTGVAYNTKSRILKRTTSGVWSSVDDPSDDFAGCIGVVYV